MSSLQSFDTLLPNITIKCISPPFQTPCVVYMTVLGSAFFIKSKLAFSLPSWQSGQGIGCILLGKWFLQMKIQIHKFGFSLQCQYLSIAYYIKSQRKRFFFIIILFLQTHDIHANSVYDHQSPNQNYGPIGTLFAHAISFDADYTYT